MTIKEIKDSIQQWNEVRMTSLGLNFLTSGSGLEIRRSEFEAWKDIQNEHNIDIDDIEVHMYIGIVEFEITFYLVDSYSDKYQDYEVNKNLFVKEYTKSTFLGDLEKGAVQIPPLEFVTYKRNETIEDEEKEREKAINGAFTWLLYSDTWFKNKQKEVKLAGGTDETGPVRVFKIPFVDFVDIFNDPETQKAFLFFGIRNYEDKDKKPLYRNEIELLLCSKQKLKEDTDTPIKILIFRDVTSPCPPFSMDGENFNLIR
ncbi:MAG: hypothetical protein GKR88_07105 [Flavobacteriaceae bacterium]|nr:MAG: hypothetical protein GKR88_07105 [Flavobacteriaceae bacterium]